MSELGQYDKYLGLAFEDDQSVGWSEMVACQPLDLFPLNEGLLFWGQVFNQAAGQQIVSNRSPQEMF